MWSQQKVDQSSSDQSIKLQIQRAYTVLIAATDRAEEAYNAYGLPIDGEPYPAYPFVFVTNRTVDRVSPIMVIVTVTYSGEIGFSNEAPTDVAPKLSWRSVTTDEAIDQDFDGNPIVTKNNEPIEGLTERFTDDLLVIEKNFLSINRYALRQYRRATNSDTFYGWPPGTARILDDEADAVFVKGRIAYWRVRVSIQFRWPIHTTTDKSWYKRVRHEGFYVRDAAGDPPHIAWDPKTKSPMTRKTLLDKDGLREDDPNNAFWQEFKTLGSLPFAQLGLS